MLLQQVFFFFFFCKIYTVNVHRKYSFSLLSLLVPLMTMLTLTISKFLILPDRTPFRSSSPISPFVLAFCTWPHIPSTGIYVTSPSVCVYWWLHILVPFPYLTCSVFKSSASERSHSLELTYDSVRCCLCADTEALVISLHWWIPWGTHSIAMFKSECASIIKIYT